MSQKYIDRKSDMEEHSIKFKRKERERARERKRGGGGAERDADVHGDHIINNFL